MGPKAFAKLLVLGVVLATTESNGESDRSVVPSAFFVSKSHNNNQVHYSVDVDETCAPRGDAPVRAYWRMLEKAPTATEPLLAREEPAYGIAWQRTTTSAHGERLIELAIRGLPSRPVSVRTRRVHGACMAEAWVTLSGSTTRLLEIHLRVGLFGVDAITMTGVSPRRGFVREQVR